MRQWLAGQWDDIRGNVKFAVVSAVGSIAVSLAAALLHGLTAFQQGEIVFCFAVLLCLALWGIFGRRAETAKTGLAAAPAVAADAPQLLIRFQTQNVPGSREELCFRSEGATVVDPQLGPLTWQEERPLLFVSGIGTVSASQEEKRPFWVKDREGTTDLYSFMRRHTPHHAETTVLARYRDLHGRRFVREFLLTSETDGSITWRPGPVRQESDF